jgi:putative chromate ion transporter
VTTSAAPTLAEAFRVFARIGVMSFGGPAGQIALMHRELVEQRPWLTEQEYLRALNFCMLLPGPEAMQLATYAGWRLHGVRGGLVAGLLFVLPGAAVVLAISVLYSLFGRVPLVEAAFFGVKAAVLAIVLEALIKVSKRALKTPLHWMIATAAFIALFAFAIPFPLVIAAAGLAGWLTGSAMPAPGEAATATSPVSINTTLTTVVTWLVIWFAPVAAIALLIYPDHLLVDIGLFFSKLAVVTFGGAYAVLAYMGQQAVETHNWLTAEQMIDGLGLAETTPGPLILVTEFVGYMAGFRSVRSAWLRQHGPCRSRHGAVGHLRALLLVDFRRRALCRAACQHAQAECGAGRHHCCCGRRHCKPGAVVRPACAVCQCRAHRGRAAVHDVARVVHHQPCGDCTVWPVMPDAAGVSPGPCTNPCRVRQRWCCTGAGRVAVTSDQMSSTNTLVMIAR